jgi:cytochrome d ubiquinol oxidase subunit I
MPAGRWFRWAALASIATPFLGNSFGWIFTEMGRQPWVVAPNPSGVDGLRIFTAQAVSGISTGEVVASLVTLTALYGVLAVVEVFLILRYVRAGLAEDMPAQRPPGHTSETEDVLGFAY